MVGALPKELDQLGHDVRVICPAYGQERGNGTWSPRPEPLGVDVGTQAEWARTWESALPDSNVPIYFIEHEDFFGRAEIYAGPWGSHADNDLRFIFFCRAALSLCLQMDWIPDVIHCHDWTTGFIPLFLNTTLRDTPLGNTATVFTIHNLEHQGYADRRALDFARIPQSEFRPDSVESNGAVNMMKAGLYHSTKLTTVSPTYAREIRTPAGGHGLDPVLTFRGADLVGIINGVDRTTWNPATDLHIASRFSPGDMSGKVTCKAHLQAQLGLSTDPDVPLFGIVARFASQKGLDLLAEALPHIMDRMQVQFAILGSGDPGLEHAFRWAAQNYRGRVGIHIGYNAALSHQIIAGSDFFVMPSRAEPCGLTQLYSMRYGTIPIVRATGGLIDTVAQYQEATGAGTGLLFQDATSAALYNTIGWACSTYYDRPAHVTKLRATGMAADFSWRTSADRYVLLYRWAAEQRRGA